MASPPARTRWVLSVGALFLAASCVAPATGAAHAPLPGTAGDLDPGDPAPPRVQRTLGDGAVAGPDGMYAVPAAGEALASHGPDTARQLEAPGVSPGFAPGDPERAPVCATDHFQHVIYARAPGTPDRLAEVKPEIQAAIRRMNAVLNTASLASGGGTADYRVLCDPAGEVRVDHLVAADGSLAAIATAIEASGLETPTANYTVFFDGNLGSACGIGTYADDQTLAPDNRNTLGGGFAVVYEDCWFTEGPMHETGHNQGAVQYGAPNSTGVGGHCNDERDVMCYSPDGGDLHQDGTVSRCPYGVRFDCGADDYFDTAPEPGEYLESHWNLGSPLNPFMSFGPRPDDGDPGTLRLRAGKPRWGSAATPGGRRAYWVRVPGDSRRLRVAVGGPPCAPEGCDADLDLYLEKGAEPTEQAYSCRSAGPTSAERCVVSNPGRGRWYLSVVTSAGTPGTPFSVKAAV